MRNSLSTSKVHENRGGEGREEFKGSSVTGSGEPQRWEGGKAGESKAQIELDCLLTNQRLKKEGKKRKVSRPQESMSPGKTSLVRGKERIPPREVSWSPPKPVIE